MGLEVACVLLRWCREMLSLCLGRMNVDRSLPLRLNKEHYKNGTVSVHVCHVTLQFRCCYVRYGRFVCVRFRASVCASGEVQSATACDSSAFVVTFQVDGQKVDTVRTLERQREEGK
jgi:hypothetical protein